MKRSGSISRLSSMHGFSFAHREATLKRRNCRYLHETHLYRRRRDIGFCRWFRPIARGVEAYPEGLGAHPCRETSPVPGRCARGSDQITRIIRLISGRSGSPTARNSTGSQRSSTRRKPTGFSTANCDTTAATATSTRCRFKNSTRSRQRHHQNHGPDARTFGTR